MRIAVSLLSFRPGCIGGAETYIRHLIPAMAEQRGEDEIVLVAFRDNVAEIEVDDVEFVVVEKRDLRIIVERSLEAMTPYRSRGIEKVFQKLAADVVLFPQQSIFPKRIGCPVVLTVVDLQHLFLPQNFSLFDTAFRRGIYQYSLEHAQQIIAISQFTKQTLIDRYGLAEDRIAAIPLGFVAPDTQHVEPPQGVHGPYVYYPAATFPHKNHTELFAAVAKLHRRGEFPYKLVLSGMQTRYWRRLQALVRQLQLSDVVIQLGYVTFRDVCSLYAGAEAVVFPTKFEGFGLPVVEAASLGKKVIVSQLEVFEELGVPARFRIDFRQPDQLLRALREPGATILEKPVATWQACAAATLDVLRRTARDTLACRPTL